MDFGRQRGFLLYGEDTLEKVGCRKESYFLEFMSVDVARDLFYYFIFILLFCHTLGRSDCGGEISEKPSL